MNGLMVWVESLPLVLVIVCAALVVVLLILVVWELRIRAVFKKIIHESVTGETSRREPVNSWILKLHVGWLENLAKKQAIPIMDIFDFRRPWLERFQSGKRRKDLQRLLDFYPDFALFPCFEIALRHKQRGEDFQKWLGSGSSGDAFFLLKKLGTSCGSRNFDSLAAHNLLINHIDSFRELSGDMETSVRDFAIRVLLADQDPRSQRLLWEALRDSNARIRAAVVSAFGPPLEDQEKLSAVLLELYQTDPALTVRKAAKHRLTQEFPHRYKLSPDTLPEDHVLHVLELLEPGSKEDENLALAYLDQTNVEWRLASARFLQTSGALDRLFLTVDFGDRENLNRTRDRLEKAAGVGILGFLAAVKGTDNPASLYLAAVFLQKSGDRSLIATLAPKVFSLANSPKPSVEILELYQSTLKCIKTRGNADVALILKDELHKRKKDEAIRSLLWENLPPAFESLFAPELIVFLKEGILTPLPAFQAAWKNFSTDLSLPLILDVLKSDLGLATKQAALAILGELKLPGVLQNLLESVPLLPSEQIPTFCALVAGMNEKLFLALAGKLIKSVDADLRAAIFLGLTPAGKKLYLKDIREALNDADPEVRLAAFTSLSAYDEAKVLNTNAVKLLRDPVERVRLGVAQALGAIGTEATIAELKLVALSPDEVVSVRQAAIRGLGASTLASATDALVESAQVWLATDHTLEKAFVSALSQKTDKRQVLYQIEKFKDGNSVIRALIAAALAAMGETGEATLLELLKEDIASLKPFICQALEESGIVDIFILKLGQRDPAVRREAAERLIMIGTTKAFKGIIQAARDPSSEIRVLVTKALESLNAQSGGEILQALAADPDKRVRRYAAWATERIKAKAM